MLIKTSVLVSILGTSMLPGLGSAAAQLSVYPPVPGLTPSPYYGLRVREVSLASYFSDQTGALYVMTCDYHTFSWQPLYIINTRGGGWPWAYKRRFFVILLIVSSL